MEINMSEPINYKSSLNLPETAFSMRANAVVRELQIQEFWNEKRVYENLAVTNTGDTFTLHDGPPYANGDLHMGHALNKILKDIINRYQILKGKKVNFVLGWDCHGLPIELKVLQGLKSQERKAIGSLELITKAKEFACSAVANQSIGFKRWGVWADYNNPYLTLLPEYEAAQIEVFANMVFHGHIYRSKKPVYWSPSSQSALAEAELEYVEDHISRSIYVAFKISYFSSMLRELVTGLALTNLYVIIWTTTPWTIPANTGIAFSADLSYSIVADKDVNYIVATALVDKVSNVLNKSLVILATFDSNTLEHTKASHPITGRVTPLVVSSHVTTDCGTGLVHIAPGHGKDDFIVGNKHSLAMLSPVNDLGIFTEEAGEQFEGLNVLREGTTKVIKVLEELGALLRVEDYKHKYPYDWRTNKPVIVRATEQWFVSVNAFKDETLNAIKEVIWIPSIGENRITAMVQDRSDWCISRQRSWGVPIPVFYNIDTNEPLLTQETISYVQTIFKEKGSKAWWELTVEELLPTTYHNNGKTYRKGTDTMDVWFDSGCSWAGVLQQREGLTYPADLYLEGSDQHRGWFQSSLLTSCAVNGVAPYKTVLTHGFTVDKDGKKMSKSLGNGVDPFIVINGGKNLKDEPAYGADVLRLWVASVDYTSDVSISKSILKQVADVSSKIRNTCRFILSNLYDFDPEQNNIEYESLGDIDKYMLHKLYVVINEVTHAYDTYQFSKFFHLVQSFCVVDLSNFYLNVIKDRMYVTQANSKQRRSAQTVLSLIIEALATMIAPVLCHMAEDIWQHLPYSTANESVFQNGWTNPKENWNDLELASKWDLLRDLRSEVNKSLEDARTNKIIGSSLEARITLTLDDTKLLDTLFSMSDNLPYLFIVSQVVVEYQESGGLLIKVAKAEGVKCGRCWNYSTTVGNAEKHPLLCARCVDNYH
jgi:isoleucyl-tRNA synthetase